jgi:hypothetical protein
MSDLAQFNLAKRLALKFGSTKWENLTDPGRQHWLDAADELMAESVVEPLEDRCSVCDLTGSQTGWGILVSVRVVVAEGEEGFADITQLLCDDHFETVQEDLIRLGFQDHRHGGINYLEDETCPGSVHMDECSTPTEYGAVTIRKRPENHV